MLCIIFHAFSVTSESGGGGECVTKCVTVHYLLGKKWVVRGGGVKTMKNCVTYVFNVNTLRQTKWEMVFATRMKKHT